MNPTKEKILKEFEKLVTRRQRRSFLIHALDTYGKEQREAGEKETMVRVDDLVIDIDKKARAQAFDEVVVVVEKYECDFASVEELRGRKMTEANIKELMRRVADARQNVVAKEILSTLNALRKK